MDPVWRLLMHEAADGATNMAIDEAIMRAHTEHLVPPTVRFFQWSPPCVSLGYFQSALDEVDLDACRELGVDYVRRPTGGRAILHDAELTYSIVAQVDVPQVSGSVLDSYRKISSALLLGLETQGVHAEMKPLVAARHQLRNDGAGPTPSSITKSRALTAACFDVPSDYEIAVGGRKLVGSAQTRQDGVLLQHGSLLFSIDARRVFTVLRPPQGATREQVAAWLEARVTCLQELLGRRVSFSEVATALASAFAKGFEIQLIPGQLTAFEQDLASELRASKYASAEWNLKR